MKNWKLFFVVAAVLLVFSLLPVFAGATAEGGEQVGAAGVAVGEKDAPVQFATPAAYQAETGIDITSYQESPILADQVASGALAKVEDRLPLEPAVIEPLEAIGKYGGELIGPSTVPNGRGWDVLEMRLQKLLTFDTDYLTVIPNIAKGYEMSADMKTFTIYLREGMKWSDGVPLTADDFEFYINDFVKDSDLAPWTMGVWIQNGVWVEFERVNDYEIKWHFNEPAPALLISLASETGIKGFFPKHYLSKYHIKHNENADQLAKDEGFDSWQQAFNAHKNTMEYTWNMGSDFNPEAPTVESFRYVSTDTYGNKYYERNPYFFKVDSAGNQLPYTDKLTRLLVQDVEVQNLKGIAGEYSHFGWGGLPSYPVYKENEEPGGYNTILMSYYRSNEYAYSFNNEHKDPVMREILNDIRFRQALSLAINRDEINELVYFGKAQPRAAVPPADSLWYEDWMGDYFADYDVDQANKLLDEMGLDKRDSNNFRLRPDGETLFINMQLSVPEPAWQKNAELVAEYWRAVGVNATLKMIEHGLYEQRNASGEHDVEAWALDMNDVGMLSGGVFKLLPPYGVGAALGWQLWLNTDGEDGVEPPAEVKRMQELYESMRAVALDDPDMEAMGKEFFTLFTKGLYNIGTIGLPPQPLLIKKNLKNTPKVGNWSWAFRQWVQFLPEQFYFE